ncbi:hypothetical protein T11_17881 [Trichinella zimbabwensis]|uniref:Uncharacterized protein n=1 Tax=Trichinella zimbabwensis TaxID=268475 RepID=A0A0V1G754_9BILA|nr:hypothetical protein T11_17881 [Trichinella zimbabwensis]
MRLYSGKARALKWVWEGNKESLMKVQQLYISPDCGG